jgi:hypothetical protein
VKEKGIGKRKEKEKERRSGSQGENKGYAEKKGRRRKVGGKEAGRKLEKGRKEEKRQGIRRKITNINMFCNSLFIYINLHQVLCANAVFITNAVGWQRTFQIVGSNSWHCIVV